MTTDVSRHQPKQMFSITYSEKWQTA
jgi:hypothetical protein